MNDLTTNLAKVNRPPVKFHPPKSSKFSKRSFGSQGKDHRSFRAEWYNTYDWLHYDASSDSAFCHVCMVAEFEEKLLASTKGILPSSVLVLFIGKKQLQPLKGI